MSTEEYAHQLASILGLLNSTKEHQEQGCALIDSLRDDHTFMELIGHQIRTSSENGRITLHIGEQSHPLSKHSALLLRLLSWDIILIENITALELWDVTTEELASALSKLTSLTDLILGAGASWQNGVTLKTLPAEMALCQNLETLVLKGQYDLQHSTVTEDLNLRHLSSDGLQDSFFQQLLPHIPKIESIQLPRTWRKLPSINSIPDAIGRCRNLRVLNLKSHYGLKSISPEIGNCTQLTSINVAYSNLNALPDAFHLLSSLNTLNISGTGIRYLSRKLLATPSLRSVQAAGCRSLLLQNTADFKKKVRWDNAQMVCYPNNSYNRRNFVYRELAKQK